MEIEQRISNQRGNRFLATVSYLDGEKTVCGSKMASIFKADGCVSINSSKANPSLQADLFGD